MESLTTLLNKLNHKDIIFRKVAPLRNFNTQGFVNKNPYPFWIDKKKKWDIFGVFTDYVIRKMIDTSFHENVIKEKKIVAEKGYRKLFSLFNQFRNSPPDTDRKSFLNNPEKYFYFYQDALKWISNYKNARIDWISALIDIYYLSYLDEFTRADKIDIPEESPNEILETINFFHEIERYLNNMALQEKGLIILNPIFGHNKTLKADGDLLIGDTLIEIKTVKSTNTHINNDYYQLLGYVALHEWLKKYASSEPYLCLKIWNINKIGFFFPVQLEYVTMNISAWPRESRLNFLDLLMRIHNQDRFLY